MDEQKIQDKTVAIDHNNDKQMRQRAAVARRRNYKKELLSTRKELELAKEEIEKVKDQLLRKAAEFDNYRRRTEKDFSNLIENANAELIRELLPVLDDLERSLSYKNENIEFDAFYEGIQLIHPKFLKILHNFGLKAIEAVGKEFDPNQHDALLAVERDSYKPNMVIEEHLKGYRVKDRVIRHSQVIVSK